MNELNDSIQLTEDHLKLEKNIMNKNDTKSKMMKKGIVSLCGKIGTKPITSKFVYCRSSQDLYQYHSEKSIIDFMPLNQDTLGLIVKKDPSRIPDKNHNVVLASHIFSLSKILMTKRLQDFMAKYEVPPWDVFYKDIDAWVILVKGNCQFKPSFAVGQMKHQYQDCKQYLSWASGGRYKVEINY